jgi:hypothetical protein
MLLKKPEAVLLPLWLALDTRDERLVGLALGALQKMLGFCSVTELAALSARVDEGGRCVVARLEEASSRAGEGVQLRVLQTLVTVLMARDLPESELRAGLALCCALATAPGTAASPAVASVAQAALRQAVALCAAHEELASELVTELCATACGDPPAQVSSKPTLPVDSITALELVEGIASKSAAALLPPLVHRLLGVEKSVRGQRALLRLVQRVVLSNQTEETEVLLVKVREKRFFFFFHIFSLPLRCVGCWGKDPSARRDRRCCWSWCRDCWPPRDCWQTSSSATTSPHTKSRHVI